MKHKHAELIKQWADNKKLKIQYQDCFGDWKFIEHPSWSEDTEYRIKPEPVKEVRYRLVYVGDGGSVLDGFENLKLTFVDGKLTDAEVLK